jgi:hypothetical protein
MGNAAVNVEGIENDWRAVGHPVMSFSNTFYDGLIDIIMSRKGRSSI